MTQPDRGPTMLHTDRGSIFALAFSPDTQWLASGGRYLHLWRVDSQDASPIVLRGHSSTIGAVQFSADGRWLAGGSSDQTIRVWPVTTEQRTALACKAAGRNFTLAGWEQYFPNEAYRTTCIQAPFADAP